jgi:hypothetical protein
MNQLLNDKKFGFNKFLGNCPCGGGGGGGSQTCTTPYTQTKWTPNGTPKLPMPEPVQEGDACWKHYISYYGGINWSPEEPKEKIEEPVAEEEKCEPEKIEPCKCGTGTPNSTEPEKSEDDPPWSDGTDESRTFSATAKFSFKRTSGEDDVPDGWTPPSWWPFWPNGDANDPGQIICGPGNGSEEKTVNVTVAGKNQSRSWSESYTTTVTCG